MTKTLCCLWTLWLSLIFAGCQSAGPAPVRFGIVTDIHYADIATPQGSSRQYRQSPEKLREALATFKEQTPPLDFIIELGDFKDQEVLPKTETTIGFLKTIEAEFQGAGIPAYHVLGNHDMDSLDKDQVLTLTANPGEAKGHSYYAFDKGGIRFIVLDANFRADGQAYDKGNYTWTDANIPPEELAWLGQQLAAAKGRPVVVFCHQLLGLPATPGQASSHIGNAAAVRTLLEGHGRVLAVFCGHEHAGGQQWIQGIPYCTMKGMIEGGKNAYSVVEILTAVPATVRIQGFGRETSRTLVRPESKPE